MRKQQTDFEQKLDMKASSLEVQEALEQKTDRKSATTTYADRVGMERL
jgi:hypothetical protein